MNIVEKVYCRLYQFCFRLAGPFLPYTKPIVHYDCKAIPNILIQHQIDTVLVVTDQGIQNSGILAPVVDLLTQNGINLVVYDETSANPTVQNVEDAYKMYCENKCQALIGFGGGSSMDCAKCVGARVVYPHKTIDKLKGLLHVLKRIPLLIAVPTTAGTGSEVTVTAVITEPEKQHKYTLNNFTFIPPYAILDPKLVVTLPSHLTATTGMDALTHAVEAFLGQSGTKKTDELCKKVVKLIFTNLYTSYLDGQNLKARKNMLIASFNAGIAFSRAYVGYVHGVAHSLGGAYNIPHGLANAVILPHILEMYGKSVHKKLHILANEVNLSTPKEKDVEAARKFIEAIRLLNKKMGIPENFVCIQDANISKMAKYAAKEANPLYPVPKLWNAKDLENVYKRISAKEN